MSLGSDCVLEVLRGKTPIDGGQASASCREKIGRSWNGDKIKISRGECYACVSDHGAFLCKVS